MDLKDIKHMSHKQIIHERKLLEKKYTTILLEETTRELPTKDNRMLSVSPTAFYYVSGISANQRDIKVTRMLHSLAHNGKRLEIEKEIISILNVGTLYFDYFFEFKNYILEMESQEELNKYFKLNSRRKNWR